MNTFWLVWCHYGVYHIIVSGCVSAKLPTDLLFKWNMGKKWYFTAEKCAIWINNPDACIVAFLFFLRLFSYYLHLYCFLKVCGLFGAITFFLHKKKRYFLNLYSFLSFKSGSLLQTSCHSGSLPFSLPLSLSAGTGPGRWWTVTDWLGPMLAVAPRGN